MVVHGIRANLRAHALLIANTAFIGAMLGVERSVVPLLAKREFGVTSAAVALSFIASFGAVKAVANLFAGRASDRRGRRTVLIAGWLVALPVPAIVILAPSWEWVVAANVLLGANQGLTWTMTIAMMSDLAGRRRRGAAMGANELTGYVSIAIATWAAAEIADRAGLRPAPFLIAVTAALAGLVLARTVPDTRRWSEDGEAGHHTARLLLPGIRGTGRALTACYQAGMMTKVNDAAVWGLVPLLLLDRGVDDGSIGIVAAAFPLAWGLAQGVTGALSDVIGRRALIATGLVGQAAGLVTLLATGSFPGALAGAGLAGFGTALAYPTLLASVGDLAPPGRRGAALGAYRFWRDLGLVVGAVLVGVVADRSGYAPALAAAAVPSLAAAVIATVALPASPARRPLTARRAS